MKSSIIAVCMALFVASPARADDKDAQPVTVPFDLLQTRHMVVMVKINGDGPYRMIFDTGAPVTLLNNKTARAVGAVDKNAKGAGLPIFPGMALPKLKSMEFG